MKKLRLQLLSVIIYTFIVVVFFSSSSKAETYFGCYAMKYGADFCGPCRALNRYIHDSDIFSCVNQIDLDSGRVGDLPVETIRDLFEQCRITTLPLVIIYKYEYNSTTGAGGESELARIEGLGTGIGDQNSTVRRIDEILNGDDCVQRSAQVSVAPIVNPTPFIASISDFNPNPTVTASPSYSSPASFTSNPIVSTSPMPTSSSSSAQYGSSSYY